MYPGITLYPNGGAFMLCESVSEFDENVPPPIPEKEPVAMLNALESCDPVIKMLTSLSSVYDREIKVLMSMGPTYDDPNMAIANLEAISSHATTITNALQRTIGKLNGLLLSYCHFGDRFGSSFNANLGHFMKNSAKVHQQGIASMNYVYNALPGFIDSWYIKGTIGAFANAPEVFDRLVSGSDMLAIVGSENRVFTSFDGPVDFISCVFEDKDRMARLEEEVRCAVNFDDLMRDVTYAESMYNRCDHTEFMNTSRAFFLALSPVLRQTCQTCYDTVCKIVDSNITQDVYTDRVKPMLARWVNIFAIGVVLSMHLATRLRENIARKHAVDDYTNLLLHTLKTV